MKNHFLGIASFILVLIIGGGLVLFNAKPIYSDSSNLPIIVGGTYYIHGGESSLLYKILTLPNSSGWMKVELAEGDGPVPSVYYININNAFSIKEKK